MKWVVVALAGIGAGAILDALVAYWMNDRLDRRRDALLKQHLDMIEDMRTEAEDMALIEDAIANASRLLGEDYD